MSVSRLYGRTVSPHKRTRIPYPFKYDRSNSLAKGLVFYGCVIPGGLHDLVNNIIYPLPSATIKFNTHGNMCAEYDGTNIDSLTPNFVCGSKTSYITDAEKISDNSVDTFFTFTSNSILTRLEWGFANTQEYVNFNSGTHNLGTGSNEGLLNDNLLGVNIDSESAASESSAWIYRDGSEAATDLGVANFNVTDTMTDITIGGRSGPASQANFRFTFLAIYGDTLVSEADHKRWAEDRYQLLVPRYERSRLTTVSSPPSASPVPVINPILKNIGGIG